MDKMNNCQDLFKYIGEYIKISNKPNIIEKLYLQEKLKNIQQIIYILYYSNIICCIF